MKTINSLISVIVLIVMLVLPQMNVSAADVLTWENRQDMPTARYSMGAAVSAGKIYAIGGDNYSCTPLTTVEEYDPDTNTWSTRASMPTGRWALGAATGPDGKIYALGGAGGNCGDNILGTVEVYDPATDAWESGTNMPTPRMELGVVAATNGRIYAMGGKDISNWFATVEEYDPTTDTWTTKNNMPWANKLFAITAASNGKIYVLGGDANVQALLEYDPATDTWVSRASMPTPRTNLAMSQASNGRVYAVGGNWGGVTNLVESYNPEYDNWSDETWISTPRSGHNVITVGNTIYAIGGWGGSGPIASVEAGTLVPEQPVIYYVATTGDDNNDCLSPASPCATIDGAISKAADGETIKVATGTYTGNGGYVVSVSKSLTLSGGWSTDFSTQSGLSIIDGQNARTGLISGGGTATVDHFKIMNGYSYYGAGGIDVYSPLILNNSIVINNRTEGASTGSAGGIFASGDLTLNYSVVQGNTSSGFAGGGGIMIYVYNTLNVNNSIITDNHASASGGGILLSGGSGGHEQVTNILNSTISNNTAEIGGGIDIAGWWPDRIVTVRNSIIAGNTVRTNGPDCVGTITIMDHSLIGNTRDCIVAADADDLVNVDPLFVDSANQDLHLQAVSPAIDAGTNKSCPSTDFDGAPRFQDGNNDGIFKCDMGAFEFPGVVPPSLPPIADAGGPYTANKGEIFTLDASNSYDPEGGQLTYEWDLDNDGQYSDATGVKPEASFANGGNFTIGLRVTDPDGLSDTDKADVTIKNPAPNDNFINATQISSFPFTDSVDITDATTESGEPSNCYYSPKTVWYTFTPNANMWIQVDLSGSYFGDGVFNVYQATVPNPGITDLSPVQCAGFGSSATFTVQAGVKYYIQAGSYYGNTGNLQLNIASLPGPVNDDFENATLISSLPFDNTVNTQYSTRQTGEPTPSCASYSPGSRSVWYAFTPAASGSVSASVPSSAFAPVLAAYTGTSLNNLTQIGCQTYSNLLTFRANAGTTYYFQVGNYYSWEAGGSMQFHLDVAPQPIASFYYSPSDPSVFDMIQFADSSYDPGQVGFQSYAWNFGDGATSTSSYPTHKYANDGDYTVQLSVTTVDGRTASATQVIQVRTRDVAITKLSAPQSASPGQTRTITVSVSSKAYPETVQIDLYKSVAGGLEFIGTKTLVVPAYNANRTVAYNFNYTFTSGDASIGKVTFRAVATIVDGRDIYPADNEAYSIPTKVNKRR